MNRSRLRMIGATLGLAGGSLLLGVYLLFDRQWLAALETGRLDFLEFLGWFNVFGYIAIGLIGIGAVLLLASFVPRRG